MGSGHAEPLFEEVKLSSVRRDLFGDTLDDAAAVDFGKLVKGRINDAGDVDFIKFIPERTAEYLIGVTSNQPVNETLFGPDQAKLADGIHAGADSFIKARLESGNSYYLKIDGPAAEYTVSMTARDRFGRRRGGVWRLCGHNFRGAYRTNRPDRSSERG